ncbi:MULTISPECIES: DUF397 domain-containing protein [unclassified Streptomyces]|uniref:DUF397 domain-containing protein n=1 Tax=unclassified Streptomyces TaxID=2593676 RepID=UPI000939B2C2|nr:DUF397 domain-containing protein [Streptomyces sp. TSRI0281]OKI48396.1 hypothetical protein A6A29_05085 [Streptomyces sp. TSRI0281]
MKPSSSDHDLSTATWHKSSYCGASGGNCLEVGVWLPSPRGDGENAGEGQNASHGENAGDVDGPDALPRLVPVRDSKRADGPAILFRAGAWEPFLGGLKHT